MKFSNYEELNEILEKYVIEGSSIGVHQTRPNEELGLDEMGVYHKILTDGMYSSGGQYSFKRISSTFCMCGQLGIDFSMEKLKEWYYIGASGEDKKCYKIIIALPEMIQTSDGVIYYCGKYGKDSKIRETHPGVCYDLYPIIPKEYVVGCVIEDFDNMENKMFFMNDNYIGLKTQEEQQLFYDTLSKKGFELNESKYNYFKELLESGKEKEYAEFFTDYINAYNKVHNINYHK